ncbi:hyaluronoglucosaminidase [Streptomyces sp. NBC_01352]|uniref:hyaluronoglucosaminidase n=1 Tax=unclassified Streptomyces TaxID=2593676 RepID=UPI00225AC2DE|nr:MULTISPECIES: hyaluronoglucosaminidase [unclassified Streptomyces]MCX4697237.1 hyaluronoglucosaminidase [Streptomyces sp. NBC_01373]
MPVGRRVFLGGFTAGAVTVAAGGAQTASAAAGYTDYASPANFWSTSTTDYTVTINCGATSGTSAAALNVTSVNPDNSAMHLSGKETRHGTLKISHNGYLDGSDADAAALSIDLKTTGAVDEGGTAAKGIYVYNSTGPTTGALIALRNNPGLDDFIVRGSGRTGIGIGRGATPQSQLHVVAGTGAPSAILAEGAVRLANVAAVPNNAPAYAGGGSLYAQDGKLFWKGGDGTKTELAPA